MNHDECIFLFNSCPPTASCTATQFTCDNKNCIDTNQVCNNNDDCGDSSDERFCSKHSNFSFHLSSLCTRQCIFMFICKIRFSPFHFIVPFNAKIIKMISSVESQKGVIAAQRCSVENQKRLMLYKVYGNSALLVLNGTSVSCNNALLALNWRYANNTKTCKRNVMEPNLLIWSKY